MPATMSPVLSSTAAAEQMSAGSLHISLAKHNPFVADVGAQIPSVPASLVAKQTSSLPQSSPAGLQLRAQSPWMHSSPSTHSSVSKHSSPSSASGVGATQLAA